MSDTPQPDAVYGSETRTRRIVHIVAWVSAAAMVMTVAAVIWGWTKGAPGPLYLAAALWATIPPLWFWYEHFYMYRSYGLSEGFEVFKHGQQVSAAIWAGVTLAVAGLAASDHFKAPAAVLPQAQQSGTTGTTAAPTDRKWDDISNMAQTAAIVIAGVWFGVQWLGRRQLDAAVVIDVETNVFPADGDPRQCLVELAVVTRNATAVGAGIDAIRFTVKPVVEGAFPTWSDSWLPAGEEKLILTRDSAWRLVKTGKLPRGQLAQVDAVCETSWQPKSQAVRFSRVFSTSDPHTTEV